jgi:1-acyl-sn-glycerol-3-phosphate acyltransferase
LNTGNITYNKPLLVLRSTVYWIWSILNTLMMALPVLITAIFSRRLSLYFAHMWLRINLFGLRLICGLKWQVEGKEHIPQTPCVVLSKHQSTWETYFLPTILPPTVYVAKRSLALIPIFGWALVALRFILIDRKSGSSAINQIVTQSLERMSDGYSVIIFPEGTRVAVGAEPNYRIGGAVVAEKTGTNILPVAVNSGEFWPRMGYIKWPGTITVSIGPVIESTGRQASELLEETQAWIESKMKEISVPNRFPY